jgi:hypothetical protein
MPSQQAFRVLSGLIVIAVFSCVGLGLFYLGILRARHLVYVYTPLSLVISFLVASIWDPILSTWVARLLFGIVMAALVMIPMLVILRIQGVDIDDWDRRRRK